MRASQIAVAACVCLFASSALADVEKAPVASPAAGYSATKPHTIVVRAEVTLVNTCWSNPRLEPMVSGDLPNRTIGFAAMADNSKGHLCGMIIRRVGVCAETSAYPNTARNVVVVGSNGRLRTTIRRTARNCG